MQRTKFTSVPKFIKAAPKKVQPILEKLRETINHALPRAEETISYNIPCYKINGQYVVYFAGYINHISVYPIPKNTIGMKVDIEKHKAGKGTLRFEIDKPLPMTFIKKVVKQLAKEKVTRSKN